jgi:hypothetical protein
MGTMVTMLIMRIIHHHDLLIFQTLDLLQLVVSHLQPEINVREVGMKLN